MHSLLLPWQLAFGKRARVHMRTSRGWDIDSPGLHCTASSPPSSPAFPVLPSAHPVGYRTKERRLAHGEDSVSLTEASNRTASLIDSTMLTLWISLLDRTSYRLKRNYPTLQFFIIILLLFLDRQSLKSLWKKYSSLLNLSHFASVKLSRWHSSLDCLFFFFFATESDCSQQHVDTILFLLDN